MFLSGAWGSGPQAAPTINLPETQPGPRTMVRSVPLLQLFISLHYSLCSPSCVRSSALSDDMNSFVNIDATILLMHATRGRHNA